MTPDHDLSTNLIQPNKLNIEKEHDFDEIIPNILDMNEYYLGFFLDKIINLPPSSNGKPLQCDIKINQKSNGNNLPRQKVSKKLYYIFLSFIFV